MCVKGRTFDGCTARESLQKTKATLQKIKATLQKTKATLQKTTATLQKTPTSQRVQLLVGWMPY
jgi:hypothetical protein